MSSPSLRARVVLLAGPSGSGKSTLAAHLGWPVLRLDDFYREGSDPLLPRDAGGAVDWDHPRAWNADGAVAAITELAESGSVRAPVYDIGNDCRSGERTVAVADSPLFIAEGLFADRVVDSCREAGVLADALVLTPSASLTAARRFVRDVSEARKPVPVLLRRGFRLWREQPQVVRRCVDAGMRRSKPNAARQELTALVTREPVRLG
ncbi:uridine kinase family protein [Allokutzneria oryzae]|uniref:Uridine kinase n=1 Tax=Allokutzneria oryzae TaxID=1378989 RepID=A0ABV5ZQ12_9PSEU